MASTSGANAELEQLQARLVCHEANLEGVRAKILSLEQQQPTHGIERKLESLQQEKQSLLDLLKELQHEKNLLLRRSAAGADLKEEIRALADKVAKLSSASGRIISETALELLKGSVFLIMNQKSESGMSTSSSEGCIIDGSRCGGVGVCVSAQKAVTAAHNLEGFMIGDLVKVFFPGSKERLQLKVEVRNEEMDYAVLATGGQFSKHLPLYSGPSISLVGKQLAMCAFQLGIQEELPEWSSSSLGVMPATGVKLSRREHHLLYASDTWPGDSGGALVMYSGELVGLHVCGVNALKEKVEKRRSLDERVTAVEDSLESAARSVASGCIALLANVFADEVSV